MSRFQDSRRQDREETSEEEKQGRKGNQLQLYDESYTGELNLMSALVGEGCALKR